MKERTFTARLRDGTSQEVTGPALRIRIEGRYRHFVVHPCLDGGSDYINTISEVTTGLRLATFHRATRCPRIARERARERVHGLLEQGLGPAIHSQIEARQKEHAQ